MKRIAYAILGVAWLFCTPVVLAQDGAELTALDGSISGTWYDPTHDGEGILVEILSEDRALSYWFTYDDAGNQLWILSVGTIDGNRIVFEEAFAPQGARFGESFDSEDVVLDPWGSYTMTFATCDSATLEYDGIFGEGSQEMIRLTSIAGVECGAAAKTGLNASVSAAWYDPQRVGEGFLIEVLDAANAVVFWFTYDPEGRPLWIIGEGVVDGNRVFVESSVYTRGGIFGPDFDPDLVERIEFGPMAFSFNGSGQLGSMAFVGPRDFGDGEMRLVRLTELEDVVVGFDGPSFNVTGELSPVNNLVVDSDVNNPDFPFASNDTADTAQALPNPVRLAGFASASGSGNDDSRFAGEGDVLDVYRIRMAAGQAAFMEVSDHDRDDRAAVDLDLLLFTIDDLDEPVDASQSLDDREMVTAPESGEYFLVVDGFSGASPYVITTGQPGPGMASKMSVMDALVPFEAVVVLEDGDKATWTRSMLPKGLLHKGGAPDRELLVGLADAKSASEVEAWKARFAGAGFGLGEGRRWETLIGIKRLNADPAVAFAEPNFVYQTQAVPNDEFYSFQWHYPLIGLEQAWDITTGSRDVVVSVIDTGVGAHPDNAINVDFSIGFDFVRNTLSALDFDGIDPDADDPGDRGNPDGTGSYHGTHVAGTVGADTNNGGNLAGVNWEVTIMPVRTLGRGGSGSGFDIIQGFRWSAGLSNDSGTLPSRSADIVNLSLGGPGMSQAMADAIDQARQKGVIVVAAAGNSNSDELFFPASYDGVVSVAATTITDSKAPYSNFGSAIDIAAPGGNTGTDVDGDGFGDGVLSLLFDDSETPRSPIAVFYNGTSMASPHVAGIAALMKAVHPELSPEEFDQAIMSGEITVDLGEDGPMVRNDTFGFGRIDALAAVQWAQTIAGGGTVTPILVPTPQSLNFGAMVDELDLELRNGGGEGLAVEGISVDQSFVTVSESDVDANGLGVYRVAVDRTDLPDGRYRATIRFDTGSGMTSVPVSMEVGEVDVPGEFGTVFAVLLDPVTSGVLGVDVISGDNPSVEFEAVLSGEYLLLAGTDLDNDGFICDAGELCGGIPEATDLDEIVVDEANLDVGPIKIDAISDFAAGGGNSKGIRRLDR